MRKYSVAIIGGGIAGLTVAHELAEREDFAVTVYERNSVFGGKARSMLSEGGFPGEHSVRTVGNLYYHFRDTLSRIPTENDKTVLSNVVPPPASGTRKFFLFQNFDGYVMPSYFPYTKAGFIEYYSYLNALYKYLPANEIHEFFWKVLKAACMCDEHRFDALENISWDDYFDAANKSQLFQHSLLKLPEYYVAATGNASAKSMVLLTAKILLYPLIHPIASQSSGVDIFNAPSSDALIDPWLTYLKKSGVTLKTTTAIKKINLEGDKIKSMITESDEVVTADIYVCCVPIETMQMLITEDIQKIASSLANIKNLRSEASSGIQFFNTNDNVDDIPKGWIFLMDSPWSIIALYQSHLTWPNTILKPPVKGILSLTWSNFNVPGVLYNKAAKDCTALEMKNEIIAQVKMHRGGAKIIDALQIHSWHIDPEIEFDHISGVMKKHHSPLFVQFPGSWKHQPSAHTEIPNLFIAADYARTTFDLATMEAANEAGRRATNEILRSVNHPAKPCMVLQSSKTGMGAIQFFDKIYYDYFLK